MIGTCRTPVQLPSSHATCASNVLYGADRSTHGVHVATEVGFVVLAPIFLVEFERDQGGLVSLIFATIQGACVRAQLVLEFLRDWGDAPRFVGGVAHVC